MVRKTLWTAALAIVFASSAPANFEAGQHAWRDGRADEALVEWLAAANSGDERAMLMLGRMHREGLGVPQNLVEAHMWLSLAASRGENAALAERDALYARMKPEERTEARSRAMMWVPDGGRIAAGSPARSAGTGTDKPPPPKAIREAQELLDKLGFEPGPPDGIWNSQTKWAYQRFLSDAGLPPAETLTPEALRALRNLDGGGARQPSPSSQVAGSTVTVPGDALGRAAALADINGLQTAIEAGADLNARDKRGLTPLMHAADRGFTLIVELLLNAGADPDMRAVEGPTALFMAVAKEHVEIVELLLESGADASIRGQKGMAPMKLAERLKNSEIVESLKANARKLAQERRLKEDSDAYSQAQSEDTQEAYAAYRSSWCPRGKFCKAAQTRIDELIAERISGQTFGGLNSKRHQQAFVFSPTGDVTGMYRGGTSIFFGGKCLGSWRVERAKVRITCRKKGTGTNVAIAEFKGDTLVGREEPTSGSGEPWTWRMNVRVGEIFDSTPTTTNTRQGIGEK